MSKEKDCPRPLEDAYRCFRSEATHASATALITQLWLNAKSGVRDLREGRIILIKDLSPSLVDLVNLVPIPNPIRVALGSILHFGIPISPHLFLSR